MDETNPFYRAHDIMSERGMCKNTLQDHQGRVCLFGAINYAEHETSSFDGYADMRRHTVDLLARAAVSLFPERGDIETYGNGVAAVINNHPDTEIEDCLLILKHAGALWEAEAQ